MVDIPPNSSWSRARQLLGLAPIQSAAPVAAPAQQDTGPHSLLGMMGFDIGDPSNAMALQFLQNAMPSTGGPHTFDGVQAAGANAQQLKLQQQQANEAARVRSMQIGQYNKSRRLFETEAPDLVPLFDAGQQDQAWSIYSRRKGLAAPNYVTTHPGDTVRDMNNPNAPPVIDGSGTTFLGTDLKSQAFNLVVNAQSNPSAKQSPQFKAAWAIINEPTMTPQGMMTPNIPQEWGPTTGSGSGGAMPPQAGGPTVASAGLQAPAPATSQRSISPETAPIGNFAMVAGPAQTANLPNIVPGTKPYNESQSRLTDLTNSAIPDLKRVVDNFGALQNTWGQLIDKDPTGLFNGLKPEDYQRASGATKAALGNVMYFVSGAAQGYTELNRKLESYLPSFGDHPGTVVDKLDRFANDIVSMANASQDPGAIARAQQAIGGIKQVEDQILSASGGDGSSGKTSTGVPWSLN